MSELLKTALDREIKGDISGAEALLLEAAESGSGHAAHNLGVFYIVHKDSFDRSYEKSRYWLEISLVSGFEKTISTNPEWFKKDSLQSKD